MSTSTMSVIAVAFLTGCLTLPSEPSGPHSCKVSPACPADQVCVQGKCMEDPVTLAMEVVGGGTVTSTPPGMSCSGACEAVFERGAQITLVAAAAAPLAFAGWSAACAPGERDCTLTLTADMTVGASFAIPAWIVTAGALGHEATGGIVAVSGDHVVFSGGATIGMTVGGKVVPQAGPFVAKLDPATRDAIWIRSPGGSRINAIGVDRGGNSVAVGNFDTDENATSMIRYDHAGELLWRTDLGASVFVNALGVDAAGDLYLGGVFFDTIDLGGGPVTALGEADMFVARYHGSTGAYVWARTFGGVEWDALFDIVVDPTGAVDFGGYFRNSVDFGGQVLTAGGPAGDHDGVFGKLDASTGATIFAKKIGSTSSDLLSRIAADSEGNLYVSGYLAGPPDTGEPLAMGSFIAKYTSRGAYIWSRNLLQEDHELVVDSADDLVVVGTFANTLSPGNGITLQSAGDDDVFVGKLGGKTGDTRWATRFGGPQDDRSIGIALDGADRIYAAGRFSAFTEFEGEFVPAAGTRDLFLVRIDR